MKEMNDHILKISNLYSEISSLILDINKSNIDESILNFLFLIENDQLDEINIYSIILNAVRIRSANHIELSLFLKKLEEKSCKINFLDFKIKLLNTLLEINDNILRPCNMHFIYISLYETSLYEVKDVIDAIRNYYNHNDKFDTYHFLHFAWFAPEIFENDTDLFNHLYQSYESVKKKIRWSRELEPFLSKYDQLKEKNWEMLKNEIDNKKSIINLAINNDTDTLIDIVKNDLNIVITPNIYNSMQNVVQGNVSLLELAAYYSSVSFFKFLLLKKVKTRNGETNTSRAFGRFHLTDHWTTVNFAVAGGNSDIIHFLEDQNADFNGCLEIAIIFHHNSLFKWLFENKKDENDINILIQTCIHSENVDCLLYLLDVMKSENIQLTIDTFPAENICSKILQSLL